MPDVGQELLNAPFPEMVVSLASAIAEGQFKLDMVSCEIAKIMGSDVEAPITLPAFSTDSPNGTKVTSMIGAGFQPTFYQFTDTIIELKMAITMTRTRDASVSAGLQAKSKLGLFSASVNASYSSKYSYSVTGSSLLRTNIKPVPTNAFLTNYLEQQAKLQQENYFPTEDASD